MNQQENRRYSFVKRTFWSAMLMMSLCASGAQAQTVLKGTVHDSSGEPLVGVTVVMNGNSKTATVTDIDGRYSVNVGPKQKADYLSFSYVGMKPANVKSGGKSGIDVALEAGHTDRGGALLEPCRAPLTRSAARPASTDRCRTPTPTWPTLSWWATAQHARSRSQEPWLP